MFWRKQEDDFFITRNRKNLIIEHDKVVTIFEENQIREMQKVQEDKEIAEKYHIQKIQQ